MSSSDIRYTCVAPLYTPISKPLVYAASFLLLLNAMYTIKQNKSPFLWYLMYICIDRFDCTTGNAVHNIFEANPKFPLSLIILVSPSTVTARVIGGILFLTLHILEVGAWHGI